MSVQRLVDTGHRYLQVNRFGAGRVFGVDARERVPQLRFRAHLRGQARHHGVTGVHLGHTVELCGHPGTRAEITLNGCDPVEGGVPVDEEHAVVPAVATANARHTTMVLGPRLRRPQRQRAIHLGEPVDAIRQLLDPVDLGQHVLAVERVDGHTGSQGAVAAAFGVALSRPGELRMESAGEGTLVVQLLFDRIALRRRYQQRGSHCRQGGNHRGDHQCDGHAGAFKQKERRFGPRQRTQRLQPRRGWECGWVSPRTRYPISCIT